MRIEILLFEGFDELDAIGPYEVFQQAAQAGADLQASLVTADDRAEVQASHGLRVRAQGRLNPTAPPDWLVIPGGGWNNRAPQGVWAEAKLGTLSEIVAQAHRAGARLASVCTGAMLLAASGLMRGREVVTHHSAIEDLRAAGAKVVSARVVDDGDLVTAGGVTSGLDLALWLVERLAGADIASRVEDVLEYRRQGRVHMANDPRAIHSSG